MREGKIDVFKGGPSISFSRLIKLSALVWILSIVVFTFTIAYTTKGFAGVVQDTNFGNSILFIVLLLGSMGIGSLAFIVLVLSVILKVILEKKFITFKKTPRGITLFIVNLLFIVAIFPLFLLWKIFRQHKKKVLGRLFETAFVLVLLLPIWIGGYWTIGTITRYQLGYVPEDMTIVGTGSMYPTWPKGIKGKDPKELAKEVIATEGFLKYPNGVVIFGNRVLGHTIGRGDIVTAENEEIRKSAEKIYGTPSGVMKRVIAIGGDTLELKDGIVYLNDRPQKEPYVARPRSTFGEAYLQECKKITVPDDSVFLMGDNRKGSGDSREFGPVKYSEIGFVLPLSKQKGKLDKNWHDATNDLTDTAKPKIDRARFVELLNQNRKENGAGPIRYEPKLEKSATLRGDFILKHNDFEQKGNYTMERSMADAGYWNTYWWEWPIQGYYEADELIEDYLERDWTDAKNTWFDKNFDDIGIAEIQGTLNSCPTQIIVVHVAGYIPPNYKQEDIESWKQSVDNLNSVIPSWEAIKGKGWVDENELTRLLNLLYTERSIASNILSKMESNRWLTKEEENSINEFNQLSQESAALAKKLNQR